jgi:soluble cytochrome b562
MPPASARIHEIIRQLQDVPGIPPRKLQAILREVAVILSATVDKLDDIEEDMGAERDAQPVCKPVPAHLDVQKAICHMLRKSREVRYGLRDFRKLYIRYAIPGLATPDEKTLTGYQQGFDRAVGELAKFLRVHEKMVEEWERSVNDEEEDVVEEVPRSKQV